MSTQPTQTCLKCGRSVIVKPDGRGFPPDIARRRLERMCKEAGHACESQYQAGFRIGGPITGQGA